MTKPGITVVKDKVWKTADLARELAGLYGDGWRIAEIAEHYDLSESHVRNYVRAWKMLTPTQRAQWANGKLPTTQAFKLSKKERQAS
jgi:transposase